MMSNKDINMISSKLLSIDSVREMAGGNAAVVTYTQHDKFTYKETMNDDVSKFTVVLEKIGSSWKVAHAHRATGQKPK